LRFLQALARHPHFGRVAKSCAPLSRRCFRKSLSTRIPGAFETANSLVRSQIAAPSAQSIPPDEEDRPSPAASATTGFRSDSDRSASGLRRSLSSGCILTLADQIAPRLQQVQDLKALQELDLGERRSLG
jgi:hypothetical protein